MSNLQKTYQAAVAKLGSDLTQAIANSFGGIGNGLDGVPADRCNALDAALNRVMSGGHISSAHARIAAHGEPKPKRREAATEQDEVFRGIRAEAYGADEDDGEDAKPAAKIDAAAIYAAWNRARRTRG